MVAFPLVFKEIHSVFLYNFHRLELFKTGLLYEAVVIHIAIVGKMTRIGNVAYIAYLVPQELEGTIDKVTEFMKISYILMLSRLVVHFLQQHKQDERTLALDFFLILKLGL